jgi:hypothetical protein
VGNAANAGEILQRLRGVKVQLGRKQEGFADEDDRRRLGACARGVRYLSLAA